MTHNLSTGEKAAYLHSIQAPELLDKLVQAILRDGPDDTAKAADVIRKELDRLHPPSLEATGDKVNVQLDKATWSQLQVCGVADIFFSFFFLVFGFWFLVFWFLVRSWAGP